MSLHRSKSAPHPISGLVAPGVPRSLSFHDFQAHAAANAKASSSRMEKEDPFSLLGFFPTSFGNLGEEEKWSWLREQDERDERPTSYYGVGDSEGLPVIFGQGESDELMWDAIKGEDKLGVLSLATLFVGWTDMGREEYVLRSYLDEPVDHESLYVALKSRRKALTMAGGAEAESFGELFLAEENGGDWNGWQAYVYPHMG